MKKLRKLAECCFTILFCYRLATAQQKIPSSSTGVDLTAMSIEDLMNVKVTSVSKTEQKLSRTASAVFVITQEDIERSGAANIPDLLRMVPGLEVAQINGSTWAISARGFNDQSSDKLLVLIDGRAVYSPLFPGVDWDAQAVPLENIDRIEVIRGPGASVWGANAVNGVISIISKKADQTQGGLVAGGGGTNEQGFGMVRYGGTLGNGGAYRITSNYSNHSDLLNLSGRSGDDSWNEFRASLRADKQLTANDFITVGMNGYSGGENEMVSTVTSISPPVSQVLAIREQFSGWSMVSKWDHVISPHSDTSLQVYFDRYNRHNPTYGEGFDTIDIDFQHHFDWGDRQQIVWGLGYRHESDAFQPTLRVSFDPEDRTDQIFSSFFQDQIAIRPDRLFLTMGAKLEHNDITGFAIQPTARVAWIVNTKTTIWSSFSIADRTPSFADVDVRFAEAALPGPGGLPILVTVFGNPQEGNEQLYATELGYRQEFGTRVSIDLTAFFNQYTDLRSTEPMAPYFESNPSPPHLIEPLVFANLLFGETHGAEASINWRVSSRWTLSPGYSFLAMHLHPRPTSQDTGVPEAEGSSPAHQAQLRSNLNLHGHFQLDSSAFFVEGLPIQNVPSYTRLDAGVT
jgi:iron complex outermembrane receptor protein